MSAVLGGDPDEVAASLQQHGLTAANNNGGGQVVAAGTLEQLAAFAAEPPAKARVIPLKVAGAFHTAHMAPAVELLEGYARAITTRRPRRPAAVQPRRRRRRRAAARCCDRLVQQVSNPVRWDLCMRTFADLGVTGLIEIPPAGTLTNLAKRNLPGVEVLALKTPDDLEQAHRMIREHGRPGHDDATAAPGDSGTLVTSPSKEA